MITIFTIPKPFTENHIRIIQRNALHSWTKLHPEIDIILLGDDAGVGEMALELKARHIPIVNKNEYGTPLLDSAFDIIRKNAHFDTIVYANTDIILLSDFTETLKHLPKENSLTIGRRTNVDIKYEIDFNDHDCENKLRNLAYKDGILHSPAGIDYFIFNKKSFQNMPPFAVGRPTWDNWTVYESRRIHKYTIDATEHILALHQNHDYIKSQSGSLRKLSPEALNNKAIFKKSGAKGFSIEDANWKLTKKGLRRNYLYFITRVRRYVKSLLGI